MALASFEMQSAKVNGCQIFGRWNEIIFSYVE